MFVHSKKLSAYSVYLIFSGASAFFFTIVVTVNLVYQVEVAKLNPLQLVLVGTVLEVVCFICQVPTGILADVYSRRLAVIVGVCITGLGFILEGSIPTFVSIMFAQALFGIGATFTDGAEQAWITDELGEGRVGPVFMRSTQVGLIGGLLGAVVSVGLASIRLNLPLIIGGGLYILLAAFLLLFMPENGFRPLPRAERQSWQALGHTFLSGMRLVRLRRVLLIILCVGLIYGLSSEGFDRLSVAHLLADFTFPSLGQFKPVVWFGIFAVVGTPLTLGASELVNRFVNTTKQRSLLRAMFIVNAWGIVSIMAFGLAGNFFLAAVAFMGFGLFRNLNRPLYNTWLAQNTDANVRATVFSVGGQVDALGQIIGGPPVGYIGAVVSLRAAMIAVGIILSPVLVLLAYAARRSEYMVVASVAEEEPLASTH